MSVFDHEKFLPTHPARMFRLGDTVVVRLPDHATHARIAAGLDETFYARVVDVREAGRRLGHLVYKPRAARLLRFLFRVYPAARLLPFAAHQSYLLHSIFAIRQSSHPAQQ